MKQVQLRIFPNGKIEAETHGVKGKACLDYIKIIEQLTGARTIDSDFTDEYYQVQTDVHADTVAEVEV